MPPSGSTRPAAPAGLKACVHLQHDMVVSSERYAKGILNITENDRCFSVAKLFFAYGLGNGLYFPLAVGATSILLPSPPRPQQRVRSDRTPSPDTVFLSSFQLRQASPQIPRRTAPTSTSPPFARGFPPEKPCRLSVFHRFKERFGVRDSGRDRLNRGAAHDDLQSSGRFASWL